jgi:tetratricopeptide (TPR) repeat protein
MKRTIAIFIALLGATAVFAAGTSGGGNAGTGEGAASSSSFTALDWYNAGYTASNAGKYQEAIGDFQKAIALKSDYAEAYNMLGYDTRMTGKVKEAFTYYDKALKLKPNFPEAREYYGEAYLQLGNLAKAVQQYIILEKAGDKNASELLEKIGSYVNSNS